MAYYPGGEVNPALQQSSFQYFYGKPDFLNSTIGAIPGTQSNNSAASGVQPIAQGDSPAFPYMQPVTYTTPAAGALNSRIIPNSLGASPNATYFSTVAGNASTLAAAPLSALLPMGVRASPGVAYFVTVGGSNLTVI